MTDSDTAIVDIYSLWSGEVQCHQCIGVLAPPHEAALSQCSRHPVRRSVTRLRSQS